MSILKTLPQLPGDPILQLGVDFVNDRDAKKVNLGIGSYKDSQGLPHLFTCVKKASLYLAEHEKDKEYTRIEGEEKLFPLLKEIVFDKFSKDPCLHVVQTIGGTGALRVISEFLKEQFSSQLVLPEPTWPNHRQIFEKVGFQICNPAYLDKTDVQ